ncbi:XrtA/PEP-CTERM system histidine kinase PrsK [Aquincola sp. J276]|uniref:XrtA/PEP-CTERM system histidine kinase PrsK n=1 Tax=Aquincola sp. J276 TaxID=2898432 RepID=UPI00215135F1|nr:XrtA/PEP-CTERM system histidine kinase PrsK [Aquincola sp. J276]MCR5866260.1 PEP-CTERM system histidine kinase PrsK [Aquincola sp. J276]
MADFAVYGWGFTAVAYTAFALSLRSAARLFAHHVGAHRLFALAMSATAVWAATGWLALALQSVVATWLFALFDTVRYGFVFVYLLQVLQPEQRRFRGLRAGAALMVAGALLASLMGLLQDIWPWTIGRWSYLAPLMLPVFGLILLEQLYRRTPREFHWNIKPLCLGLGFVFIYDVYLFSQSVLFGGLDDAGLATRGPVHAMAVPLLFIATRRHADWRASAQMSRAVVFHTATLMFVGAYLLMVAAIGYYVQYFSGDWGRALQLATVFLALLFLAVLMLSGSVRARLRVFIAKNFFAYRYDYRAEWLRFTARLSGDPSAPDMGARVVQGLAEMLQCPGGALWALASRHEEYSLVARWNVPPLAAAEPAHSPLCRFLCDTGWIIDLDEYRARPAAYKGLVIPSWLTEHAAFWLVIPLFVGPADLLGFVVLKRPAHAGSVTWEVRDLLKTASRQGASFLAQSRATEALLEAQKFDAFHRMSAFVVHDLKNIITQLSLMMQNAKRLKNNPEFQQDMLLTVESSLEKMQALMQQLREGDKPLGVVCGVDMGVVSEQVRATAAARGRTVALEIQDTLFVRGQEERLARVLGHLVQNALDATPPDGRVSVRVERSGGNQARVVVADTGQGMSPEFVNTRLFKPFSTTKPAGMGIGAYESHQYVSELGGRIEVDSAVGRGTTITLLLPLHDAKMPSEADLMSAP